MNKSSIEINDLDTWPTKLLSLLKDKYSIFVNYINRNNEILDLRNTDYLKFINAFNQFTVPRQSALEAIEAELNGFLFIGYHCTRITEREKIDFLKNGIKPASYDLYIERVNNLFADGYITKELFYLLLSTKLKDYTSNEVWIFFGKEDLKSEGGVGDLLEYWGGEALYNSISSNRDILKDIGFPSIIKIEVDLIKVTIEKYAGLNKVANAIVNYYLLSEGFESTNIGIEFPLNYLIESKNIVKIINTENALFSQLTKSNLWDRKL